MPPGAASSAWNIVRARPEAALLPPDLASAIPSASVAIESHRGKVAVAWWRLTNQDSCGGGGSGSSSSSSGGGGGGGGDGGGIGMNVTIPPGSTGEVHIPMPANYHRGATITLVGRSVGAAWRAEALPVLLWSAGTFSATDAAHTLPSPAALGVVGVAQDGRFVEFETTGGSFSFVADFCGKTTSS